ncbi:aspartate/glutamate racemase family protein [uncultured Microbulbifer sp.]|uniref:aspartate/glutamate racemase family protein n=1 Tax=uncultured Microbulbifer sp. TaxID=348147 RepID=UPI0026112328|nr:aspartate/glutamate racemase family protein [uncultured Microbulbifer sp.]
MKKVGLLGGMSWESTQLYYKLINQGVNRYLGGLHSAEIILYSVDFARVEKLQKNGDWQEAGQLLAEAARCLESAGADCILICTNTMHKVAKSVVMSVDIPLLHIADAVAEILLNKKITKVGLLGTAFTMEQDFYREYIQDKYGVTVIVPDSPDRAAVHKIIFEELCKGVLLDSSRELYLQVIDRLSAQGAEAVILGCTEIGLLVSQDNVTVPLLDTTQIHASKAVKYALSDSQTFST